MFRMCFALYAAFFTILIPIRFPLTEMCLLCRCAVLADCKPIVAYSFRHNEEFKKEFNELANKYIERDLKLHGDMWTDLKILNEDNAERRVAMKLSMGRIVIIPALIMIACVAESLIFATLVVLMPRLAEMQRVQRLARMQWDQRVVRMIFNFAPRLMIQCATTLVLYCVVVPLRCVRRLVVKK